MGMNTVAVALDAEQVEKMRALAGELVGERREGLAERARAVGYRRESMHLQPTEDGGALLLVHLEYEGDDVEGLRQRVRDYPENDFTRWFNERFVELFHASGSRPQSELLFEWSDD